MNALDADTGRSFDAMSARERQEALAEELQATMEETDEKEAPRAEEKEFSRDWSPADIAEQERMAEALLFAAAEPLDDAAIAARLPAGADIPRLLAALQERYQDRGVILSRIAGKWRFATALDVAHVLETEQVRQRRLSRAALETLAIIAYHQPCTRADIEDVRGVMVAKGSLDQLLEIGWVRMRGRRRDAPGRPVLYGTTQSFLEHFGLESVSDLPGLADLKAAGLLDARLPPGFAVPNPVDGDDAEAEEDEGDEAEAEFAQDFLDDDGQANGDQ
ncbi:MAG TPA: SMC-Scp complex subunit ScpB [Parvularculaceae bacterium]|nr:SMC-Scp complex subunit ScpB [Parvularculaceae bacterium]